jgi:uncharacterized protein (DUF2267 family)
MVHEANLWIQDICTEMDVSARQRAYHALRGVLFTLRDRLPVNEVLDLAAQFPTLIRGIFFEGYSVHGRPRKYGRDEFLFHVANELNMVGGLDDPEETVRAVLRVINAHISEGEVKHLRDLLPAHLKDFWPLAGERYREVEEPVEIAP